MHYQKLDGFRVYGLGFRVYRRYVEAGSGPRLSGWSGFRVSALGLGLKFRV